MAPPTDLERGTFDDTYERLGSDIVRYQAELKHHMALLKPIEDELNRLQKLQCEIGQVDAPIRRCSQDTMLEIFRLAFDPERPRVLYNVCQPWREMVKGPHSASIWSRMHLLFGGDNETSPDDLEWWLERTRNVPLDLTILWQYKSDQQPFLFNGMYLTLVIERPPPLRRLESLLNSNRHRINSLELCFPYELDFDFDTRVLDELRLEGFPELRDLYVGPRIEKSILKLFGDCPKLEVFSTDRMFTQNEDEEYPISFQNLRCLKLTECHTAS
jgi:hypothetical protein